MNKRAPCKCACWSNWVSVWLYSKEISNFFSAHVWCAVWCCGYASAISYGFEIKLTSLLMYVCMNVSKCVCASKKSVTTITQTVDKLLQPQWEWWNDLRFSNKTKPGSIYWLLVCLLRLFHAHFICMLCSR